MVDQSSLAREIVDKSHRVRSIEQTSGPSMRTQTLRMEIARLEAVLKSVREGNTLLNPTVSFSG
ncbi:MAG: hypothetical protein IIC09_02385 [Proteobacteria bacterium]|nr:hypothetical protein [Pseudomonadota bacterium]